MGLETNNAYNGTGEAVKLNRYLEAYLTTPSVSSVGSISLYYRNFTDLLGGGSFILQKSIDNGPFTDLITVDFSATDVYELLTVEVNDPSENIKFRIYIPEETNTGYLCIDEIIITDIGQTLAASPSSLSDFHYYYNDGPSVSQSFVLLGTNLTGFPDDITITAPANYEVSLDNTTFSNVLSVSYASSSLTPTTIYVRLIEGLEIGNYNNEDISISGGGATSFTVSCNGSITEKPLPLISVTPSSLSGYTYVFGSGPSGYESFSLSVSNLNDYPGVISLIAPTGFHISTDFVTYTDSLTIPYNAEILTTTLVYARLKPGLSVNAYSGDIVINAEGVLSTVACNGNVTVPENPTLTATEDVISGFTYIDGFGPSESQSFEINGYNLTGSPDSILVSAPSNYEISFDDITYEATLNIPFSTSTLDPTIIYLRLVEGLAVGAYNNETISIEGGGASPYNVSCYGNVISPPSPILSVNETELSGFEYSEGSGPSIPQSFNLSAVNLNAYPDDITVTAPLNYEVSYDYPNFAETVYVPYDSETLDWTPIYVRLKSELVAGEYNSEYIVISVSGADDINVSCNGTVEIPLTPYLSLSPTSLSGFSYIVGNGPSAEQSYMLSGANLTGYPANITVTAPTNYEISLSSGSGFSASLSVPFADANFSDQIYVRLKSGLAEGDYNAEEITHNGGGASEVILNCSGTVDPIPPPYLSLSPTSLSGFSYIVGNGPSAEQSYTLSGSNLTGYPGNITLTAPTNFEISMSSGSGYTTSLNIPYSSSTLNSTQIYVRLKSGLSIGTYNSEIISNAGGGASTVNVICNGNVTNIPPPTISVSPSALSGFAYTEGNGPSPEQSYTLSGTYLTGYPDDIVVTAPANYEISLSSGSGFTNALSVSYASATLSSTSIYVRLKSDLAVGTYNSEFITNSGGGATDADVTCNGTVSAVSTDPCLEEDFSGFTAGTHASPNSIDISSSLDTYTNTSGWTGLKIYSAGGEIKLGSSSTDGYIITPTIDLSAGGTLEFDYAKWSSDDPMLQIFHAADGVNFVQLGSDIAATTDFQAHSVEITGGTASSKIKIGGTERIYLDNIVIYCGGSVPTPMLVANPTSLSGFNYTEGSGPSAEQSFELSGTDLNGTNLSITPPTNHEISLSSGTAFQNTPINLSAFDGTTTTVYVRLKSGLGFGNYNSEQINISGGGASDINVICNGSVEQLLTPELLTNPEILNGFTYIFENGPSAVQSFELSGNDLDDSQLDITPPENFEISLSESSGYASNPIILNSFDGNSMSVYVRLKADLPVGNYNDEILTISGSGAATINLTCSGYVEDNVEIGQFTNESIHIYPNPANHSLFVDAGQHFEHFTWTICDITGRVFNNGQVSDAEKTFQIDISELQSGLYVLILTDGHRHITRKIEKL
jgi:hypothetical protein